MRLFLAGVIALSFAISQGIPTFAQEIADLTANGSQATALGSDVVASNDGGNVTLGDITGTETVLIIDAGGVHTEATNSGAIPGVGTLPAPTTTEPIADTSTDSSTVGTGGEIAAEPALAQPTAEDQDADNYPDAYEPDAGLDPYDPDTDDDSIADGDEVNIFYTDPLMYDTDGDGSGDGDELWWTNTDPLVYDAVATGGGTEGTGLDGGPSCEQFADWYSAQDSYELAGGVNAPSNVVQSLDADMNGIACEWMME